MNDYIRLPRSTLELIPSALYRGVFLSLLERADDSGQLAISVRSFADEIGVSYQVLRTALAKLSANATINAVPTQGLTQRLTHITICRFADYNTTGSNKQRSLQRKANATSNAVTALSKTSKFIPPTDEEVASYVQMKGYHFDPETFVPWYQSKGWKVGDQPMKDWQAACRTWELRWKEKHGEQYYYEIKPTAPTSDNAATRKESRDRLRTLACGVLSQSADKLLNLYNGGGADPDNSENQKRSVP